MANENNTAIPGDFFVNTDNIRQVAGRYLGAMQSAKKELEKAQPHVESLKGMNHVGNDMGKSVEELAHAIDLVSKHISNIDILGHVANAYDLAESNLLGIPMEEVPILPVEPIPLPPAKKDPLDESENSKLENKAKIEIGKTKSKTETGIRSTPIGFKHNTVYDPNTKGWKDNGGLNSTYSKAGENGMITTRRVGSIAEYGSTATATASVLEASRKRTGKVGTLESEAYLLRAEASAGYGVGAMMFRDKDGYHMGVGAHAEAGVSATLAGGSIKGDIGVAALGANAGASVAIGQVSAQAGAVVGYVDGHLTAYAEGSVGANAVSVSGSVAARLAGIEVGVKGSLTVGVGAYGNIGFKGGKFHLGFGISLGIGFKIDLTLDFSKIGEGIKTAGKAIATAAKAVGKGIATAAKAVANGVKKAAKKVWKALTSW